MPRTPPVPVVTADLFAPLGHELIALLEPLDPAAWDLPTSAGSWTVFDVAAHLLDGNLRKLSFHRDRPAPPVGGPPVDYEQVLAIVNGLNADWIRVARRLSPAVLLDLLAHTDAQVAAFVASLAPHEPARFGVAWAGEDTSPNWLDTGREYTERWHHQQQIRAALGASGLVERRWLFPVIDVSMESLRRAYQAVDAPVGTTIAITVTGAAAGRWQLVRGPGHWQVRRTTPEPQRAPEAAITVPDAVAWRIFFRQITPADAAAQASVAGDAALTDPFFSARAVMV